MTNTPFLLIKKILKALVPPILLIVYRKLRTLSDNQNILFDGDDALFKKEVLNAYVYGEYGCGKSTKWILNNTSTKVISVDTSALWVKSVQNDNKKNNNRLNIHYSNLGEVGSWGRPKNFARQKFFSDYTDFVWNQADKPTVVLVDGRFRVCCFLTSLKFAEEGTRILFDDYTNRPYYHFVEKYVRRVRECGRQCLFIVPPKSDIDIDELERDINAFRNVMN